MKFKMRRQASKLESRPVRLYDCVNPCALCQEVFCGQAREMAQSVKCLTIKHEDLSPSSQRPWKELSVAFICNPTLGRWRPKDLRVLLVYHLRKTGELRVQ